MWNRVQKMHCIVGRFVSKLFFALPSVKVEKTGHQKVSEPPLSDTDIIWARRKKGKKINWLLLTAK
jgi:hypothetical protein